MRARAAVSRRSRSLILALFALLAPLALLALLAPLAHAALPPAVAAALAHAGIPEDHVAVYVQPLDAAMPVFEHQADAAMNPASTMKLVTSFAALDTLGPVFHWTTEVWADGDVAEGVLQGDLIVRGHGDPTLSYERLWLLQRQLRASGIQRITGRLRLDSQAFELPAPDPGAFDAAPLAPYNAPPGALIANFNVVPMHFLPTAAGPVTVTPDIDLGEVGLDIAVVAVPGPCRPWRDALKLDVREALNVNERDALELDVRDARRALRLSGEFPAACGPQTVSLNLFDPETTFDLSFRSLWAESGERISAPALPGVAPATAPRLSFDSPSLAQMLTYQNKFSNNLMTRNLLLTLGAALEGGAATPDKGARAVRAVLARNGLDVSKLVVENGAGLSRIARIPARVMGMMLVRAAQRPWAAEFEASLPIAGLDGTLQRRFLDSPLAGQAHLKTGTLRDVSALAGYVPAAQGKKLAFVMFVNHAEAEHAGPAQQAMLDWVWAHGKPTSPATKN